jgi:hypothetical protein
MSSSSSSSGGNDSGTDKSPIVTVDTGSSANTEGGVLSRVKRGGLDYFEYVRFKLAAAQFVGGMAGG